jgi:hypothetical protein
MIYMPLHCAIERTRYRYSTRYGVNDECSAPVRYCTPRPHALIYAYTRRVKSGLLSRATASLAL